MLIEKLDNKGLLQEIWLYLTIKDIKHLFVVNKCVNSISLKINKIISQKIVINFPFACHDLIMHEQSLALKTIFVNFPNIYNLILDIDNELDYEVLSVLYKTKSVCKSLKNLNVVISNESSEGISNLFNVEVLDISYSPIRETNGMLIEICSMTKITSLNISNCHEIYNEVLSPLSNLTRLKYLYMDHCYGLSNEGLQHLKSLTNLEHFDLSYCTHISNEGLLHLIHLVNLKFLNLKVCAISSLSVLETLVNIETLDLTHCHLFTIQDFSSILYLNKLKFLIFYGCELLTDEILNDEVLVHLSKLINLTYLDLSFCGITSLSSLSTLVNLISLRLGKCSQLTDHGFSYISCLTNLTYLDICECDLTDDSLALLSNLTKLTYLNLFMSKCSKLSFLNPLVNINHLDLSMCDNITNDELKSIFNLTNLRKLYLHACEKLSKVGYLSLKENLPHLNVLELDVFSDDSSNNNDSFVE